MSTMEEEQKLTVAINYRGETRGLSPEASMRYRKLAKARGIRVEALAIEMLSKATSAGNNLFLPVKC